jgi:hypothetical protein
VSLRVTVNAVVLIFQIFIQIKVKQSHYRPGHALRDAGV